MGKEEFKFKVFTSFILSITFLVCVISGIILFISPPGRVANWTSWEVMGFSKHEWSALHTVFVTVFLVAGIFHLFYFNWRPFWSYIKQKTGGMHYKREFWSAIVLSAILLLGTTTKIPPVISIVDLSEYVTNSWEKNDERPPIAHAEMLTMKEYADTIKQPLDKVVALLQENEYAPNDENQTLEDLANKYNTSANRINDLMKDKFGEQPSSGKGGGSGYGKMDFKDLTKALGLTLEEAKERLQEAGIVRIKESQTLREIGMANGISGREVLKILTL